MDVIYLYDQQKVIVKVQDVVLIEGALKVKEVVGVVNVEVVFIHNDWVVEVVNLKDYVENYDFQIMIVYVVIKKVDFGILVNEIKVVVVIIIGINVYNEQDKNVMVDEVSKVVVIVDYIVVLICIMYDY